MQERYERLVALQDRIAGEENRKQLGKTVELMVVAESGRKAQQTNRLAGRGPDQRLVHFSVPAGCEEPRPGDMVTVPITEAGFVPSDFQIPPLNSISFDAPEPGTPGTVHSRILRCRNYPSFGRPGGAWYAHYRPEVRRLSPHIVGVSFLIRWPNCR